MSTKSHYHTRLTINVLFTTRKHAHLHDSYGAIDVFAGFVEASRRILMHVQCVRQILVSDRQLNVFSAVDMIENS